MHQLSPVCDNIVPYCLCVQQWMQGPGLPPFNQWISRCDRCKITWNVQATCYQNLFHQMNISIFFFNLYTCTLYMYLKWEPSIFLSLVYSLTERLLREKKNCKMMSKSIKMNENKVVIGLLILSMSIIACLTHPLRPWSWGTPGVPPEAEVAGAGSSYWLTSGCLCCSNPKGTTIAKF